MLMVEVPFDKEIAVPGGISRFTVNQHVRAAMSKMGASSRTEAAVRAIRMLNRLLPSLRLQGPLPTGLPPPRFLKEDLKVGFRHPRDVRIRVLATSKSGLVEPWDGL